ncbi:DNA polymerase III subunit beta [Salinicola tamaricis]|uniref:DNA polymerase III subunit beta n=1 Tax=Salinicola tamaricis TaxID=1771309 RepID=UPI003BF51255
MKFSISREALLRPLTLVAGVVERRQTLPVLSNVLIEVQDGGISLTGTDLEVELIGRATTDLVDEPGSVTVPARKLMDICKSLPDQSEISFTPGGWPRGAARRALALHPLHPAGGRVPQHRGWSKRHHTVAAARGTLKYLIDATSFAMAQQDVRYYLNGMLLELANHLVRTVATDGHRLAVCERSAEIELTDARKLIIPRKGCWSCRGCSTAARSRWNWRWAPTISVPIPANSPSLPSWSTASSPTTTGSSPRAVNKTVIASVAS